MARRPPGPSAWRGRALLLASIIAGLAFGLTVAVVQVRSNYKEDTKAAELAEWLAEEQAKENDPDYQELIKLRDEAVRLRNDKAALEQQRNSLTRQVNDLQEQVTSEQQATTAAKDQLAAAKGEAANAKEEAAKANMVAKAAKEAAEAAAKARAAGGGGDRHTPWLPSPERDAQDPALAAILRKVAKNNEVLVAVSNSNYAWPGGMLSLWIDCVKRSNVTNAMVVALDDDTKKNVEEMGLLAHRMDIQIPDSQKNVGSNHAVSALKFRILTHFMRLGYSVFLSDVDIVTLQNPFKYLTRDSDVESMSDGWDDATAYGYNDVKDDPSMGWARYAHSMRVFVFNSGLFYLRPTNATMDLLEKVIHRVETENGWDQALFNEVIFFPSHPGYKDPSVTRRVLDYKLYMNSKHLFKILRHDAARFASHRPAMIHVNYHPDKFERMKAIVKRYYDGDMHALDPFPNGSERDGTEIKKAALATAAAATAAAATAAR